MAIKIQTDGLATLTAMQDLVRPISEREFGIYALSLDSPSLLDVCEFEIGWISRDGSCVGAILRGPDVVDRRTLILRRQIDARFVVTHNEFTSKEPNEAAEEIAIVMRAGDPPEAIKPSVKRRPLLLDLRGRAPRDLDTRPLSKLGI